VLFACICISRPFRKSYNPLGELVGNYIGLVANPGWQPAFQTSFQLVRLVGSGLNVTNVVYAEVRR